MFNDHEEMLVLLALFAVPCVTLNLNFVRLSSPFSFAARFFYAFKVKNSFLCKMVFVRFLGATFSVKHRVS